jgi:hypothetical protein
MMPQPVDKYSMPSSYRSRHFDSILSSELSSKEADDILYVYQTQIMEYFPFVIVPDGTTTQDLRDDKPFVFATIMIAASRQKICTQAAAGNRLMEYLSVHMLQNGEKSLDLLQGLLIYLAWFVSYNLGAASFSTLEALLSFSGLLGAIVNIGTIPECPISYN